MLPKYPLGEANDCGVSREKPQRGELRAAESAAIPVESTQFDPNLRLVVERWTELPEPVQASILAMIRAADPPRGEAAE